jgi:hypothetical protein
MSYVSTPVWAATPTAMRLMVVSFGSRRLNEVTGDGDYPGDLGGLEER